ncbi:MAG: ABC-type transport system, multidrug-familypermease [Herbinix sp.]|jgi:fluoroquinolone transport system permease protein|nr:ABC-type transport system, multidrug-familypermease [Herbinix sp.]
MRIRNLVIGDIKFQIKYGFYFVYTIFTIFYVLLIHALPEVARNKAITILIYSDPAAMGLFFMGAIVLLEKSQMVLNSIAVSPVKVSEYILSKVISLGLIGTLVGGIIAIITGTDHVMSVLLGTFLGSALFSLIGLMIAAKINSLNQFMIATVPFELICFIPPMLYLFGYRKDYLLLHPGCSILLLLTGEKELQPELLLMLFGWLVLIYWITHGVVKKMFLSVGGVKL